MGSREECLKRYRVLKPVVLGFLTPRDQYDEIIRPKDNVTLESDGHTIWAIKNSRRQESITIAAAIEIWLKHGFIAEIS